MAGEEWHTRITKVEPDKLSISGYLLQDLAEKKDLLDVAHLLVCGELPSVEIKKEMVSTAKVGALMGCHLQQRAEGEDVSKTLSKYLLQDNALAEYSNENKSLKTAFLMGRITRFVAETYGNADALPSIHPNAPFSHTIMMALAGNVADGKARLLEATITACVDHGVTPPSAQATRLAATVRGAYEVCIEHGIGVITDVHGGAGMKAAKFFASCAAMKNEKGGLEEALRFTIEEYSSKKKRIAGLGHRVHNNDPRRDVLWKLADEAGVSGDCVALSRMISGVFQEETGKSLPINVDGVIGAIVADIGLDASMAKTIFIMGRAAGLSAHCYEEMETQPQMRRIDFSKAVYNGPGERNIV